MQGLQYVDVGFARSSRLKTNEKICPVIDIVSQILNDNIRNDAEIGYYLAIENIGILFEPELKLDVRSIIDSYSKNQCLVVFIDL